MVDSNSVPGKLIQGPRKVWTLNFLLHSRPDILRDVRTRISIFAFGVAVTSLISMATACGGGGNPFGVKSELVTAADRPSALAFAPDGRLFYAERVAGNEVFAKVIRETGDSVRNGESLAEPLARSGQFPAMVCRMIGVGEKTGALEAMLDKISDFYDSEVKAMVDVITSLIEPLLLMFMGIVVGGIIMGLMLPIMNLSSIVN